MEIQKAIEYLINKNSLSFQDMTKVMRSIMTGEATPSQIAGFLVALRIKGETIDEIGAAAKVMRELATPVDVGGDFLVDIVGTGGDGAKLFNVSTASSFVSAAAGCLVAKHGNRSVSSSSGAADLLECAGIRLDLSPVEVAHCIDQVGVGFMFAQNHHSAMRYAIGTRKELAIRTLFNILGPLTNPAGVKKQLLGVYSAELVRPIAEVLKLLGSDHVMVVHSEDGLDEISIARNTYVAELHNGTINEYILSPEDLGLQKSSIEGLSVKNADESYKLIKSVLMKNKKNSESVKDAASNMIALNAGAAIYVSGKTNDLKNGVDLAQDIIASGLGYEKMNELVQFTSALKPEN